MDKDIQKELDKVVSLPKKEKPELKTYMDVLTYRLGELEERGDVGYTQEILIPVPESTVKDSNDESGAKRLIATSGMVKRKLGVDVDIKTEEIKGRQGTFNMINIIYPITSAEEAKKIKEFIQGT